MRSRNIIQIAGIAMWVPLAVFAQSTRVPFVGCSSDGQAGPIPAPKEKGEKIVTMSAAAAHKLAYYKAETTQGVLAPRGWYCFGNYGSSGSTLWVAPEALNKNAGFPWIAPGPDGPVIKIEWTEGGGSGTYEVARIIARVFPAHIGFVRGVLADHIYAGSDFPVGPYPADKLTYRSDRVVEYVTRPHSKGIGNLRPGDDPIRGVVILGSPEPNASVLSVRLPPELEKLAPVIIRQTEHDGTAR